MAEGPPFDRRRFLIASGSAGLGLIIGFHVPPMRHPAAREGRFDFVFEPNAFIRVGLDNSVTVLSKHLEMGQGSFTGLATLVAEEMDADWSQIRVEAAPADKDLYNNLFWGPYQGTGGSSSIANAFDQYRRAGAVARNMLVKAASKSLGNVPLDEFVVQSGDVWHRRSGLRTSFGKLAGLASRMTPPIDVLLKDPAEFRLIGRHFARVDRREKSRGETRYTIDQTLPGMLTAVIARSPRFGAKLFSTDFREAREVDGVTDIVEVSSGVAVVGEGFWPVQKARQLLQLTWDDGGAEVRSSDEIMDTYRQRAGRRGVPVRRQGDATGAIDDAAIVLEADYEFPFLAHAPLEPLDCVVRIDNGVCDVWTGSQLQTEHQRRAASILGLPVEKVHIHTAFAGGSFGRRASPDSDHVVEAVAVVRAIGDRAPVKLIWTREDDIRGGRYRPMYFHRLRAGLDARARIVGWQHRIVGQSILKGSSLDVMPLRDGIDRTSIDGAANIPYAIRNLTVDLHTTELGVPVLQWRSIGGSHNTYAVETFLDELAVAAKADAVEFRLAMLRAHPRLRRVLERAATVAGWGAPLPEGMGRGIALAESFNTYVAQVADVRVRDDGTIKVERVICAVDCGVVVNPDIVRAQMEGGIGFGLGAVLHGAITLEQGVVRQSNFDGYRPLRIDEMPSVEVEIIASTEPPTGVGEPAVPPIGPAVANAVYAATGRRIRSLPFSLHGLSAA